MDVQLAEFAAESQVLLLGVRCWSRKKMTEFSASARWISSSVRLPSGLDRSTPPISAPMIGVSLSSVMVSYGAAVLGAMAVARAVVAAHRVGHGVPSRKAAIAGSAASAARCSAVGSCGLSRTWLTMQS